MWTKLIFGSKKIVNPKIWSKKIWKCLFTGIVPVDKNYPTGTVPVNKNYRTGTVPVNKNYRTGTVPVNKNYPPGTVINEINIFSSKNPL